MCGCEVTGNLGREHGGWLQDGRTTGNDKKGLVGTRTPDFHRMKPPRACKFRRSRRRANSGRQTLTPINVRGMRSSRGG